MYGIYKPLSTWDSLPQHHLSSGLINRSFRLLFLPSQWFLTQTINEMLQGHDGIGQHQPWPDIPHDFPDSAPHVRFIAVNGTFSACCLVLLKWTQPESLVRVIEQFTAFLAQFICSGMLFPAIPADHNPYRLFLALHPPVYAHLPEPRAESLHNLNKPFNHCYNGHCSITNS